MGGGLGIFLVHLYRAKHGDEDAKMYDEMKKQYEEYIASLKTRTVKNKPEILWDTARRNPCDN
jgi:vacuolar-type H+-ATPase subunit H